MNINEQTVSRNFKGGAHMRYVGAQIPDKSM